MKALITAVATFLVLLNTNQSVAQEWKSLRAYQKETGESSLREGCWLRKDRTRLSEKWKQANLFNLSCENGNRKYKTISQIRDFYLWFDLERERQGHEIKWIGIASIAAGQLAEMDNGFIRFFIVRNSEVVKFANEGSKTVFAFAFPLLKNIYFSDTIIVGNDAVNWGLEYGMTEQCLILDPLYVRLSPAALHKLTRMAKGQGVFSLGIPKVLKYDGRIENCKARFEHGINKLLPFYIAHHVVMPKLNSTTTASK
ncbi:hypothetical protein [Williamwhitmania taraxaci]|uniref:Uncharacterized protein n=1 Tax=Williamwhitmania taraxaci TaxID=1640674 RepID=A0A1G6RSB9_9BACT|nr:hypothetical protein [Williamwhitmania taraxaci]SDD07313.1 hypothetical protein SAMN05216323_107911 [Williamwhitmania taraxaci]